MITSGDENCSKRKPAALLPVVNSRWARRSQGGARLRCVYEDTVLRAEPPVSGQCCERNTSRKRRRL